MGVPESGRAALRRRASRSGSTLVTVDAGPRTDEALVILDRHGMDFGPSGTERFERLGSRRGHGVDPAEGRRRSRPTGAGIAGRHGRRGLRIEHRHPRLERRARYPVGRSAGPAGSRLRRAGAPCWPAAPAVRSNVRPTRRGRAHGALPRRAGRLPRLRRSTVKVDPRSRRRRCRGAPRGGGRGPACRGRARRCSGSRRSASTSSRSTSARALQDARCPSRSAPRRPARSRPSGPASRPCGPGDRVGSVNVLGAYAEYALAPADRLVPLPDGVSTRQAAAVHAPGHDGALSHHLDLSARSGARPAWCTPRPAASACCSARWPSAAAPG